MSQRKLLRAYREVNKLLTQLALGMGKSELNKRIIRLAENLFGRRKASILRLDPENQRLYLDYASSLPDFYLQAVEGIKIGPDVGSCGTAAYHKRTYVAENLNTSPNWAAFTSVTQRAGLHACWSVPILSSQDKVLGTFAIYSAQPSKPTRYELEVLEMLASLYATASEKFQLEEQIYFHAEHDSLTQCLNRRALLNLADKRQNTSTEYVACFFGDVDQFKQINDRFGHETGDAVLTQVGKAFNKTFKQQGLSGRYGGDEFVAFYFSDCPEKIRLIESQLHQRIARASTLAQLNVQVSIGAHTMKYEEVDSFTDLIKLADKAMYRIKRRHVQQMQQMQHEDTRLVSLA